MWSEAAHSSPLYVQWSRALFSALCGAERSTLLHSTPHKVEKSRALFSTLCAMEQSTLLCFMCSGVVHSSLLHLQRWSSVLYYTALAAVESGHSDVFELKELVKGRHCALLLHMSLRR